MPAALDFTTPHVLRNAREYEAALAEIRRLLDLHAPHGSPDDERLEFLSVLVEAYEDAHLPELPKAGPIAVVDFMLEQHGRDRASLAPLLGGKSRVSEFFAGKRPLSINQLRALRDEFGIPADLLID